MGAWFLAAPTPQAWVDAAAGNWRSLMSDHANCEKKAASTALALMFAYPEDATLSFALARLAREELRHFEQVSRLMEKLDVPFERQAPSRYAAGLRRHAASAEPRRKLDLMLIGALIEARSCERFDLLAAAGTLPPAATSLYLGLRASEARHFELYLRAAQQHAAATGLDADARFAELAEVEADLATRPDGQFRFHSGPPPGP